MTMQIIIIIVVSVTFHLLIVILVVENILLLFCALIITEKITQGINYKYLLTSYFIDLKNPQRFTVQITKKLFKVGKFTVL